MNKRSNTPRMRVRGWKAVAFGLVCATMMLGCHQGMWNQPKYRKPLMENEFFDDARASRPIPANTVQYANSLPEGIPPRTDAHFWTGKVDGAFAKDNYYPITQELLERGKARYMITCMPCHGHLGDGQGMIKQRGMKQPATYHDDRLRNIEDGYIFDVITNGFGVMYSYASRVKPADRWAIVAYVRALQFSQNADVNLLEQEDRLALSEGPAENKTEADHGEGHH